MLAVELAVAKVAKYAVRESGDSVEVAERPNGGLSVVIVDGQRSGRSAKAISNLAVRKAISMLAEGVRDGAVARATHDFLRTQRGGQVSAELTIISVDLESRTVVVSRNSQCPVMVWEAPYEGEQAQWVGLDEPARIVGVGSRVKPVITERPLAAGQVFVAFTDGVLHAGRREGSHLDVTGVLADQCGEELPSAQFLADCLLNAALAADGNRPGDDTTVVVMRVFDRQLKDPLEIRRMSVSFPVPPV
jgi:serine phosphatase RsbU (regulator of sigma subunit)